MTRVLTFCRAVSMMLALAMTSLSHAETVCSGSLTGIVSDDVLVENGGTCNLVAATVLGSVRVAPGDTQTSVGIDSDTVIIGDFLATDVNNSFLRLQGGHVLGDFVVGGSGTFSGASGKVGGSVLIQGSITRFTLGATVGGNFTARNVEMRDSVLAPGAVDIRIEDSDIFGNVTLQGNTVITTDPSQPSFVTIPLAVVNSQIGGSLKVTANEVPNLPVVLNSGSLFDVQIAVGGNIVRLSGDCRRNNPPVTNLLLEANIIAGKNLDLACP